MLPGTMYWEIRSAKQIWRKNYTIVKEHLYVHLLMLGIIEFRKSIHSKTSIQPKLNASQNHVFGLENSSTTVSSPITPWKGLIIFP